MPTAASETDRALSGDLLDVIPPIIRVVRAAMRDLKTSRLTVPQFRVLGFVSLQPCTSKQLAEWHGVSVPAMSRMVSYLVRRKLLVRRPDAADRRQVQLRLSAQGEAVFRQLRTAIEARIARHVAALARSDKRALATGLAALQELFREGA
ncbi:MarR family transcriptional regulator [Sulfurifustis variabilis]|uniref:MarR family transcriptional regulator n=1 Tax=Sulfurifustis variabilis TaxID=1675686 RepID=A0A1B4V6N4_9GAMM|nr:MarR family transcriptional regulator [Sulfurifustis variabilis]BAU49199.1 MarR family transcriptional regulator [Sulfurifustis variabilis]